MLGCRGRFRWRRARQSGDHFSRDRFGNFGFDLKKIGEIARKGVRAGLRLVAGLNQPDVNADLIGDTLDAAFENVLHVQSLADFADRLAGHDAGGGGRDDAEVPRVETAELRGDDIGQAGAEIVLIGIATEIDEGKDHEAYRVMGQRGVLVLAVNAIGNGDGSQHGQGCQRCTVRTSRPRYDAISPQESSFLPEGGDPSGPNEAPLAGMSGGDIEVLRCADYTLGIVRKL